jgi:hypothetical protein
MLAPAQRWLNKFTDNMTFRRFICFLYPHLRLDIFTYLAFPVARREGVTLEVVFSLSESGRTIAQYPTEDIAD